MPNRIWKLRASNIKSFANCLSLHVPERKRLCPSCGACELPPLELEWDIGSDLIGDFVFAVAPIIAKQTVAKELAQHFKGFTTRAVNFPEHPNLMRPTPPKQTRKKRVWLPYEGPPLCEMVVTHEVNLLPQSTVEYESVCKECGRPVYKSFNGVETRRGELITPRTPGQGLFVTKKSLAGCDFFKPRNSGLTLCTDRVKEFIEQRGYTNITFWEMGEVI